MKFHTPARRITFWFCVAFLVLFAIKGLIVLSQFIGYASSPTPQAQSANSSSSRTSRPSTGLLSTASQSKSPATQPTVRRLPAGDMKENNLLFDCLQQDIDHKVYATTVDPSTIDISNLFPITPGDLDTKLGQERERLRLGNEHLHATPHHPVRHSLNPDMGDGDVRVNQTPPVTFRVGILQTATHLPVYFAILANFTRGFKTASTTTSSFFPRCKPVTTVLLLH